MDRDELREKQDRLIELVKQHGLCTDLRISAKDAGSPTVRELQTFLYAEWAAVIDRQIEWLENLKRGAR